MSLRKSPTLTPALIASNRRNAKKSTGPRTERGKAIARLNSFRHGMRSPEYVNFYKAVPDAPLGEVGRTVLTNVQTDAENTRQIVRCREVQSSEWRGESRRGSESGG